MHKFWLYITSGIKYIIGLSIISGLVSMFFPRIAIIIFGLGIFGIGEQVKEDVNNRYNKILRIREEERILKVAEESKYEFEGFDLAMSLTRRNMK